MPKSDGYVSAEYLRRVARQAKHIKESSYMQMAITPGARVLDLGCGPGIDTVPMAALVGADGQVVGIDIDEDMLAQADQLAAERGVQTIVSHRSADLDALPFADGYFDALRAERLFQVLPATRDIAPILAEMYRVTRSGGRWVLIDTDWGSASVDFSDVELERRLLAFFAQRLRPRGFAGRELFNWARSAGMTDVSIELFPIVHAQLSDTPFGPWLMREAQQAGVASSDELARWQAELTARSAANEFFASVTIVMVTATRP